MVEHRILGNGGVRQARRDCRSCDMWGDDTSIRARAHEDNVAYACTPVAMYRRRIDRRRRNRQTHIETADNA